MMMKSAFAIRYCTKFKQTPFFCVNVKLEKMNET